MNAKQAIEGVKTMQRMEIGSCRELEAIRLL